MYKCSCGARFVEEGTFRATTAVIDGWNYNETFVCCPVCGGEDYWEEEEDDEDED